MKHLIFKIHLALFAVLLLSGVNADTVNFAGDTTGQPTWQRTNDNCSGLGSTVSYETQVFSLSSDDSCTLAVDGQTLSDPYLHLYTDPFDPNNQPLNCVNSNDDSNFTLDPELTNQPLVSGQTYVFVTSAWNGQGTYNASISCPTAAVALAAAVAPATATSIPTLSTWAMLLLLLTLVLASTFLRRPQK